MLSFEAHQIVLYVFVWAVLVLGQGREWLGGVWTYLCSWSSSRWNFHTLQSAGELQVCLHYNQLRPIRALEWPPLMLLNAPVRNKEGESKHGEASEFICILVIKYFYLYNTFKCRYHRTKGFILLSEKRTINIKATKKLLLLLIQNGKLTLWFQMYCFWYNMVNILYQTLFLPQKSPVLSNMLWICLSYL